jgi:integrase
MASKRHPKEQPNANRVPTRGVLEIERPGRPNPYGVQWPEQEFDQVTHKSRRVRKTLFFPTTASRDEKARELRDARRSRMMVASVPRDEIANYRAFKTAIGETPWQNVIAGWRAHLMSAGLVPCDMTVEAAGTEYLAKMKELLDKKRISADTERHKRHKIRLFVEEFGDLTLDRVTTAMIEDWIDEFDEIQSDYTFDGYAKHIRAFFGYFVKDKKVLRDNPGSGLKHRSDGIGEVKIISVAQTARLFHVCLTEPKFKPIVGRLAMEAFIGLRFGSGCRLERVDINREDKGVTLPKHKLKTKRRHYIDGLPECLWSWIDVTPDECWELTPRQYMGLKSDIFTKANVPHPHNCLRHGFATYYTAAFKNPGATATILCHRDQQELWDHYNGRATEADGKLYQEITPTTAERILVGYVPARAAQGGRLQSPA